MYELVRHQRGAPSTSLDAAIQARVEKLPGPARLLLEVVVVADRPTEMHTAARVGGVGEDLHHALPVLRTERLVRLRETASERQIEPYHHRIRDAVLAAIAPLRLRAIHAALGESLAARSEHDRAAFHLLEAGDLVRGAELTMVAASRAAVRRQPRQPRDG